MDPLATPTPEPWIQAAHVRKRCPGVSHKQARKALNHCNGDVNKAIAYLNSQKQGTSFSIASSDTSSAIADESSTTSNGGTQRREDPLSWLRQLERLPPSLSPLKADLDDSGFDIVKVIGAVQSGTSPDLIRDYLAYYHENYSKQLEKIINEEVKGFPAIFYVVETNNTELIRHWIRYGGNPNATYGPTGIPLLAFAVFRGADQPRIKATETVRTLLSLGASPDVIPSAYYNPYNKALPESGPASEELDDVLDNNKIWCKPAIRSLLASALSLTQRYRLHQAARTDPSTSRQRDLVYRRDAEALLGLHLLIIGQEIAAKSLKHRLLRHLAMPREKPLVLLFAGPSGHGKTELARKFGEMMSLELLPVDCAIVSREMDLFGPRLGIEGYGIGAPLNNFLARMSGKRCVVFMDEFEKTKQEVWNTLLIPFDQGEYLDRRWLASVNCSQTIWILASNKFDGIIHEFCRANRKALIDENVAGPQQQSLIKPLITRLRKECMSYFGAPLTGRITEIIPFLTFSPDEAAVVADKRIMELEARLAQPVKLSLTKQEDNLVGNVQLDITNDCIVCSKVADDYVPELGARSIFGGVDEVIAGPLVDQYLEISDDFDEKQEKARFVVGVDGEKEVGVWLASTDDSA